MRAVPDTRILSGTACRAQHAVSVARSVSGTVRADARVKYATIVTMVEMSREDFEEAVDDGLDMIPDALLEMVDNVVVLVEDDPEGDDPNLLGLYDGVALTDRGADWGMGELPDRIFIYRNPLLRMCEDEAHVREEVAITVVHEIAHHFGIDDERLHELGWG